MKSTELVAQMLSDWRELDMSRLVRQYIWVAQDEESEEDHTGLAHHCKSGMFCRGIKGEAQRPK